MGGDSAAAERAIAAFLEAMGHPCTSDPELSDTPARVVRAYRDDLLAGYEVDVDALLEGSACGASEEHADAIVVVREIRVQTLCPHHLLPGLGTATVAYLPGASLLGIGALARVVDAYSRRLSLQEDIGRSVVDALIAKGGARGAYCRLDMHHTCLSCRGARQVSAVVTTEKRGGALAQPEYAQRLHQLLTPGSSSIR
jgi:GTP cyclohydrolase I